jgi:hypothetical protein
MYIISTLLHISVERHAAATTGVVVDSARVIAHECLTCVRHHQQTIRGCDTTCIQQRLTMKMKYIYHVD